MQRQCCLASSSPFCIWCTSSAGRPSIRRLPRPCRRNRRRFRCRPGCEAFEAVYSRNMLVGLLSALFSPSKAMALETGNGRLTYWKLLKNSSALHWYPSRLTAFILWRWCGGMSSSIRKPRPKAKRRPDWSSSALHRRWVERRRASDGRRTGDQLLLVVFGLIVVVTAVMPSRYYRRMNAERPRGRETPLLVRYAVGRPHHRRAWRDLVRGYDSDGICCGGRGRGLPACVSGPNAQLEAHEGGGLPDGEDHGHGVLAFCRLCGVLRRFRDPRRAGFGGALGAVARPITSAVS